MYTRNCGGLKRSPCKGHLTAPAMWNSTSKASCAGSFAGKQMQSAENFDRAFATLSALSILVNTLRIGILLFLTFLSATESTTLVPVETAGIGANLRISLLS